MKSLLRQSRGLLVFAGLTLNTIVWFTPLLMLAVVKLLLPIPVIRRGLTRALMAIGENWITVNALILSPVGSRSWTPESLPDLRRDGWYLVVANHQTWVDIVVLQTVFNRRIPFLKFFIKQQLVWFPLLGIAWWALDMPFMKRYSPSYLAKHPEKKGRDLEATRRACEKFRHTPTSVINFVEGTRFSEQKRDQRQSPFRRLLVPRAGGIAIALNSMGELFDGVVDVTIAYDESTPTFWDMCCGQQVRARLHVGLRELDASLFEGDYAGDRDYRREVHRWLTQMWNEKDARLEGMLAEAPDRAGA
ncbi:MAG: acyltransferase [Pseudomonadota bacterium]